MQKSRSNSGNPRAGARFEQRVKKLFLSEHNLKLDAQAAFLLGIGNHKKIHKFDLASKKDRVIVECKSYTWTSTGNTPSAKFGFLNEVMFYFSLAPKAYRKILVMRKHKRKGISLAQHYVKTYEHLIPKRVEIWEVANGKKSQVHP